MAKPDGPIIHFAKHSDASENVEMGEALCGAGYQTRTEHDQYVAGDWSHVDCRNCRRILRAHKAKEAREERALFGERSKLR